MTPPLTSADFAKIAAAHEAAFMDYGEKRFISPEVAEKIRDMLVLLETALARIAELEGEVAAFGTVGPLTLDALHAFNKTRRARR